MDELRELRIDFLQPFFRKFILIRKDSAIMHRDQPALFQADQAVSADGSSRINAQSQHASLQKKTGRLRQSPSRPAGIRWSLFLRQVSVRIHVLHIIEIIEVINHLLYFFGILTRDGNCIVRNQG